MEAFAQLDAKVGPFFVERWANLTAGQKEEHHEFLQNVSGWSWGHSDFDWCCDDDQAPSYLLYMVTQQGHPANWTGKGSWFQAIGKSNTTILEWLRSYWP